MRSDVLPAESSQERRVIPRTDSDHCVVGVGESGVHLLVDELPDRGARLIALGEHVATVGGVDDPDVSHRLALHTGYRVAVMGSPINQSMGVGRRAGES